MSVVSLLGALLAKLLDPIFVGSALLVLMSFRSIWRYPLAILLATVVSETSLTLIQSSRVWGAGLVLSLLSGLLILAVFVTDQDLPNRGADAYEPEQPGYLAALKETAPNLDDPCLRFEMDEAHSDYAVITVREHHDPAVDCPGDPGTAPLRAIYRVLKEDRTVLKMNSATGYYEPVGSA